MLWKVLNGFSQAVIIVLALVLITTITTKHSSNAALEDFQKQVDEIAALFAQPLYLLSLK